MTAQTGRTTFKHINFIVKDSGGSLRNIPINSLSACGIEYQEEDVTAFQDAVRGRLPSMPDAPIEISGPFDTSAAQTSPALSGSHTVLSGIAGATTPLSLDIQIGIRHAWESGEPQFGITATSTSGYICTRYTVDIASMTYSARFVLFPGSALPAWGTSAES